jgi:SM-20-related protein
MLLIIPFPGYMQDTFNVLIDGFIDTRVGIEEHFLSPQLATHLKNNLINHFKNDLLLRAGTGRSENLLFDLEVRKDRIFWLDRVHEDPHENAFFDLMDSFVTYLNETCYTGITGYEFHYALYEEGSFYKKHLDQFKSSSSRQYSVIMYLNENWEKGDGGELRIYLDDGFQDIHPVNGKCVFFKSSEIEHEVLLSNKPRMSVTGWLKI